MAFIVLVYSIVRTLKTAEAKMAQASDTLKAIRLQLDETGKEMKRLMQTTERLARDVQHKLDSAQSFFLSVGEAGEAVYEAVRVMKQVLASVSWTMKGIRESVHRHQRKLPDIMEWVSSGIGMYQVLLSSRKQEGIAEEPLQSERGEENLDRSKAER